MTIVFVLVGLLALLFTGIPIFAGLTLFGGGLLLHEQGNLGPVTAVIFGEVNQYLLVAIPLFAFMAHIMIRGKVMDDLYDAAYTFTRHLPGGLAVATILACTIFSAISGSSVATALTIGAVAIPQMLRYGYEPRIAYGAVVDFLYFHVGQYGWPAFNAADSAITVGVVLMLWTQFRPQRRPSKESPQ